MLAKKRGSIVVGSESLIAFKTLLLTATADDPTVRPIRIGNRCFIGGGATIMPGVTIGDGSIVGAGSIVFDDVPPHCAVAGNPARVIREGIIVGKYGRLHYADQNSRIMWR